MNTQEHLLSCLAEECNEVAKDCSKAMRFGLDDKYKELTPRQNISHEIADIWAVIELLKENNIDLTNGYMNRQVIDAKKEKLKYYMKYAKKYGALKD